MADPVSGIAQGTLSQQLEGQKLQQQQGGGRALVERVLQKQQGGDPSAAQASGKV